MLAVSEGLFAFLFHLLICSACCVSCCGLECYDMLIHCMFAFVLCIACVLVVVENGNCIIPIYCCTSQSVPNPICVHVFENDKKSELKCGTMVNYGLCD